ncbi:kua-ubiquitin conjugating enzyme hybrid localization domain protein [Candidatus Peregrinibacteria bacterium]|nr:kua-ubiquitin conjugating enzyme hybrid localization domain protein [Candidatus Peregrinibacteria bacterium]
MANSSKKWGLYVFRLTAILAFFTLAALISTKLVYFFGVVNAKMNGMLIWVVGGMVALGHLSADFVSGMVHFLCDNFGSEKTPLIGKYFIKEFRTHHTDPEDITRHGFVETNGSNCFVALPIFIFALVVLNFESRFGYLLATYFLFLSMSVFATNQIHKWAHTENLQGFPVILQKARLIISPKNHNVHHAAPYDKYYCITTGWLNPLLAKIGFFEKLYNLLKRC